MTKSISEKNMIYGLRPLIEAFLAGKEVEKLFLQKGLKGNLAGELQSLAHKANTPIQYVPLEKMNRLTRKNHQGALGLLSVISYEPIDELVPSLYDDGKVPLLLILDRITDVRNFGAIARTAECAGVHAILIPVKGSATINADAIKTSAGALHLIPVHRSENFKKTINFAKESGIQIVACTEKTDATYDNLDYTIPTAFIMGSEEDGISSELLKMADHKVMIPLAGHTASLNVSVATGVILFEAVNQRLRAAKK